MPARTRAKPGPPGSPLTLLRAAEATANHLRLLLDVAERMGPRPGGPEVVPGEERAAARKALAAYDAARAAHDRANAPLPTVHPAWTRTPRAAPPAPRRGHRRR